MERKNAWSQYSAEELSRLEAVNEDYKACLDAGKTERENFITDGTTIRTPYSISVNPYSGNVYITDAYDYKVKGDVLCFSPQGQLIFKLPNVVINSKTVLYRNIASQCNPDENPADPEAGAFANKVLEYNPAPSQYMNTS